MPRRKTSDIIAECVEQLLDFSKEKLMLQADDVCYVRNTLLSKLKVDEPFLGEFAPYTVDAVLKTVLSYAVDKKIIPEGDEILFESEIMGVLTPMPSKIIETFDDLAADCGVEKACKWLFNLGVSNNYIRMSDISKNKKWTAENPRGNIQITINVAKPEKDNAAVAKEREMPQTNYPKCALCEENVGFWGDAKRPPRRTLRTIPIILGDEQWFFQFSPYVYFDQHCIAVSKEHRPMHLDRKSFQRMADFVEIFPQYFIGSNAPLPIVGGSILSHDHYQGGSKVLPVMSAPSRGYYLSEKFPLVKVSVVDWYNSIVRLESSNVAQLLDAAEKLLADWGGYSDESVNVLASTGETPHNTITPIARINSERELCFDMILRNNRTDAEHPHGIFHPAEDLHNIKKEGIGLIEAMGLFILPGRLAKEAYEMRKYLTGEIPLDFKQLSDPSHPMHNHIGMIAQLANDLGTNVNDEKAGTAIVDHINEACEKILDTTAVFKRTDDGDAAFDRFMQFYTGGSKSDDPATIEYQQF